MEDKKLEQLEAVMVLMTKHQIDHVELDGIVINKNYHMFPDAQQDVSENKQKDPDEDLFYSA